MKSVGGPHAARGLDSTVLDISTRSKNVLRVFLYLHNEGPCYVISLRHLNYFEAELLLERSAVSQSVWKIYNIYIYIYLFFGCKTRQEASKKRPLHDVVCCTTSEWW